MHFTCIWKFYGYREKKLNLALNNLQNAPFRDQKSKIWGKREAKPEIAPFYPPTPKPPP